MPSRAVGGGWRRARHGACLRRSSTPWTTATAGACDAPQHHLRCFQYLVVSVKQLMLFMKPFMPPEKAGCLFVAPHLQLAQSPVLPIMLAPRTGCHWCDSVKQDSECCGAHRRVIHRDLKPENILMDDACNVKVADFGLAGITTPFSGSLSAACGTPEFTAPEIIRGEVRLPCAFMLAHGGPYASAVQVLRLSWRALPCCAQLCCRPHAARPSLRKKRFRHGIKLAPSSPFPNMTSNGSHHISEPCRPTSRPGY